MCGLCQGKKTVTECTIKSFDPKTKVAVWNEPKQVKCTACNGKG